MTTETTLSARLTEPHDLALILQLEQLQLKLGEALRDSEDLWGPDDATAIRLIRSKSEPLLQRLDEIRRTEAAFRVLLGVTA